MDSVKEAMDRHLASFRQPRKQSFAEFIREALLQQRKRKDHSPVESLKKRFESAVRMAIVRIALEQLLKSATYYIGVRYCAELGRSRDLEAITEAIDNLADKDIIVRVYKKVITRNGKDYIIREDACGFINFMLGNDLTEVLGDWDTALESHISRALEVSGYPV